jgi:hypothetical protein
MKTLAQKRQEKLTSVLAEIFDQGFEERVSRTLEVFGGEMSAVAEAVSENHREAVIEWIKAVDAENAKIARRTKDNDKRMSTFVPVSVYARHKAGNHLMCWALRPFDSKKRGTARKQQELPFKPDKGGQDWRKLGVLGRKPMDLESIFRQTDAMGKHLVFIARDIKLVREALKRMDDRRRMMMALKPRRAKKPKADEAQASTPMAMPSNHPGPRRVTNARHHPSKQRWDD